MKKYEVGDIVFVSKYDYDGGEKGQNHLFVIIDDDSQLVPIEYFGMIVSSHREKAKVDIDDYMRFMDAYQELLSSLSDELQEV